MAVQINIRGMNQAPSTVALRVFRKEDLEKDWETIPVIAYLPIVVAGAQGVNNINKRVRNLYFKKGHTDIVKVRWNYQNDDEGHWVEAEG